MIRQNKGYADPSYCSVDSGIINLGGIMEDYEVIITILGKRITS